MLTSLLIPVLDPDNNLIDCMTEVQDDIRESIHPEMGVRQWSVFAVRRFWTPGTLPGEGGSTHFDEEVELTPDPIVKFWNGFRFELYPGGRDEVGEVRVEQVSLKYTEGDLRGSVDMPKYEQHYIKLVDNYGQAQRPRYYVHNRPPYPDRVKTNGWVLNLRGAGNEIV